MKIRQIFTREEIEGTLVRLAEEEVERRENHGENTHISRLAENTICIYLNGMKRDGTPLSDKLKSYFDGDLRSLYDTTAILEQFCYKKDYHLVYNASARKLFYISIDDFEDPVDRFVLFTGEFEKVLKGNKKWKLKY